MDIIYINHTHNHSATSNHYVLGLISTLYSYRIKELLDLFIKGLAIENFSFLDKEKKITAQVLIREYYSISSVDLKCLLLSFFEDPLKSNAIYLTFDSNSFLKERQILAIHSLFSKLLSLLDSSLKLTHYIEIEYNPKRSALSHQRIDYKLERYINRLLKDNSTQLKNLVIHEANQIDDNRFYINFYDSQENPILQNLSHALVFLKEFQKDKLYAESLGLFDQTLKILGKYTRLFSNMDWRKRFLHIYLMPDKDTLYTVVNFEIHCMIVNNKGTRDSVVFNLDIKHPLKSTLYFPKGDVKTNLSINPRENVAIVLNLFKDQIEEKIGATYDEIQVKHLDIIDMTFF